MKLTQLMKENEERPLSNEVKDIFLKLFLLTTSIKNQWIENQILLKCTETLGGITEEHLKNTTIRETGDWFDKHTVKRNMSELDKLGKQFDKALELVFT